MFSNDLTEIDDDAIWSLQDYAIYVPMSDGFYQTLKFERVSLSQLRSDTCPKQPSYDDSRAYLRPLLEHFISSDMKPSVLDVGGYIGRFSIEANLLAEALALNLDITCFEPGATYAFVEANLALNDMTGQVALKNSAMSNNREKVRFAIPKDAMISSRIVPASADLSNWGTNWQETEATTATLASYIGGPDQAQGFICKIDTEGHEAKVIEGAGRDLLESTPHAFIIEYWPSLLDETLFGIAFEEYVFSNYKVLDIRSSLYPAEYQRMWDFSKITELIDSKAVSNRDLLLISNSIPEIDALTQQIENLSPTVD